MHTNAFIGKTGQPTDDELAAALGTADAAWDQLLADLASEHDVRDREWKSHSPKWGWSLRVLRKKRTIVWLAPCDGVFEVVFILGDKAMRAARAMRWSQEVMRALDAARKYPEGSAVRLHVKSVRQVPALKKLAAIKLAN